MRHLPQQALAHSFSSSSPNLQVNLKFKKKKKKSALFRGNDGVCKE
jgi:hypothetical protein